MPNSEPLEDAVLVAIIASSFETDVSLDPDRYRPVLLDSEGGRRSLDL
ncbi:hypothetical protein [Natrinema halophilum]|uniref:Uncharacterized protein n=1 Tax=Natrinema halophilum TaxID=1699371 RepID=A0A7D5KJQ7_9EURY|nr:hypothetical protein [Natrinema halophilum]QLG48378.1 hypothetical protein HYG82_05710 [Natrinema halophilum]